MNHIHNVLTVGVIGFLALVGCGKDANAQRDDPTGDLTASEVQGDDFEAAMQGSWSCMPGSDYYNGADLDLFYDTDQEVSYIEDGARIDVEDGTWRAVTEDLILAGTYSVDGTTWTITPDFGGDVLEQKVMGVPATATEAASDKMLMVEGADPDTRTRFAMPSPSEVIFTDQDDYTTSCYKY